MSALAALLLSVVCFWLAREDHGREWWMPYLLAAASFALFVAGLVVALV